MPKKVVKFPKEYRKKFAPDKTVIREIKKVMKQAKSGELRGFAIALVFHDSVTAAGEVNRAWVAGPGTRWALDTAINRLVHRWRQHEYDGVKGDAQEYGD